MHEASARHACLWLDTAPEKISPAALVACTDVANTLCLSVASIWEMLIKQRFGKLNLDVPLEEMLKVQQDANQLHVLSIDLKHVLAVQDLPLYHNDPFDRLLIAQARVEDARLW